MPDWPRPHGGLRLSTRPDAEELYLDSLDRSECAEHDVDLELLRGVALDTVDVADDAELWVCPECFAGDGGIDRSAVEEAIFDNLDAYEEYLEGEDQDAVPPDEGTLEFRHG